MNNCEKFDFLVKLLCEKFNVDKDILCDEYVYYSLTGKPFYLRSIDMVYLMSYLDEKYEIDYESISSKKELSIISLLDCIK